ncbi:MAG: hypothetical protein PVH61_27780 [Candidatus Aminicenantes bacterium]|jgi:hypothetical protein
MKCKRIKNKKVTLEKLTISNLNPENELKNIYGKLDIAAAPMNDSIPMTACCTPGPNCSTQTCCTC